MENVQMGIDENIEEDIEEDIEEGVEEDVVAPETGNKLPSVPDDQEEAESQELLQERLKRLEIANKGLIKATQAERAKRHNLEEQIQQVTEKINAAAMSRKSEEEEEVPGIKVEFDDEGNAYVPRDKLQTISNKDREYQEKIDRLEYNDLLTRAEQAKNLVFQKVSNDYKEGVTLVQKQWNDLNEIFSTYIENNGIEIPKDSDGVADILFSEDVTSAFKKKHPTGDIDDLVDVYTSQSLSMLERKLRKAARAQDLSSTEKKDSLKLLKKIGKQPPSMNRMQNQRSGKSELSLDDISKMSSEDFEKMSDKAIEEIKDLLGS